VWNDALGAVLHSCGKGGVIARTVEEEKGAVAEKA